MPSVRASVGVVFGVGLLAGTVAAGGPSRFVVPKTKEEWASRRPALARAIREAIGAVDLKSTGDPGGEEGRDLDKTYRAGGFRLLATGGWPLTVRYLRPRQGGRLPAVLLLVDDEALQQPVLGEDGPAWAIVERGMMAVWLVIEPNPGPWDAPDAWPRRFRDDLLAFDQILRRDDIDPGRVAVVGLGLGGTRAAWLAALDDRVAACVAIGGLTRFADWSKAHPDRAVPPWMAKVTDGMDLEALVALCAGRPFAATAGDGDPSCPVPGIDVAEATGGAMDHLLGDRHLFSISRLGRQGERYGRIPWMGAMEVLDKAFFPQGPTPLGHPAEPEPPVTGEFVDLAADGLAGWVPEMSQRPTTWTWTDGVIACKPGPSEYGWLRAPIEVGDFVLTVEWKVPPRGNTGIFLRARPVPWLLPPSTLNKRYVSTLGLDWPSRTGLELQAQDDPGIASKYASGSLYRHAGVAANPTNPPGHWNRTTVRARGPRVEVWTNGQQVLDARIDACPLTLPEPPLRGYIGLQNHGAPAEFRGVKLLRLGR